LLLDYVRGLCLLPDDGGTDRKLTQKSTKGMNCEQQATISTLKLRTVYVKNVYFDVQLIHINKRKVDRHLAIPILTTI